MTKDERERYARETLPLWQSYELKPTEKELVEYATTTTAELDQARERIVDLERQVAGERLRVLEAWLSGHDACNPCYDCSKYRRKLEELKAESAKLASTSSELKVT